MLCAGSAARAKGKGRKACEARRERARLAGLVSGCDAMRSSCAACASSSPWSAASARAAPTAFGGGVVSRAENETGDSVRRSKQFAFLQQEYVIGSNILIKFESRRAFGGALSRRKC